MLGNCSLGQFVLYLDAHEPLHRCYMEDDLKYYI